MRELSDAELARWEEERRRIVSYRRSQDPRIRPQTPERDAPHGSMPRYRSGCRCGPCRREGNDYRQIMEQNARLPRRVGL